MITIAGSGMGPYDFRNVDLDLDAFDVVFCDQNYRVDHKNLVQGDFYTLKEAIIRHFDKNILYVVSGSPLFYSGAALIIAKAKQAGVAFKIIDNASSLSYMLSLLGISLTHVGIVSLHGKSTVDLQSFLTKPYTFVVCDERTLYNLERICRFLDNDDVTFIVGERFGYDDEAVYESTLTQLLRKPPKMPYVLLLKKNYEDLPYVSSEETIEHENGMITKSYKRHDLLHTLQLRPNELLWDIGAGSGSISIDGFKRYRIKTVLFEKNDKRSDMILNNLKRHKVLETKLLRGDAKVLYRQEASRPDKIFIGGGGESILSDLAYLYEHLADGGIILVNIVTLVNLNTVIETLRQANIAFEIKTLSVTTYKTKLLMPYPERVLHQIIIYKKTR